MNPLLASYFGVVLVTILIQLISVVALLYVWSAAIYRSLCNRTGRSSVACPGSGADRVAIVVPCYLPNEEPIIEATLEHILERLEGCQFDVHLVYNTPKEMPSIQSRLSDLQEKYASGRRLFVQRVEGSTSKADNLNYVIPQISAAEVPFTAIYDADHNPDPDSLAKAINYMKESGADCVQGSTYVREGCWLFKNWVCAEFFVTYFLMLPIMQAVSGTGFFGGANAVWRTSSLQTMQFDRKALCEDIDCFARAVTNHGLSFVFLPDCCSGELLPAGFRAFWKQRLRWAMGWDQATTKHAPSFLSADLSKRKRAGLYYIFVFRWFSQLCAAIIVLGNTQRFAQLLWYRFIDSSSGLQYGDPSMSDPQFLAMQRLSFCLYSILIVCALFRSFWYAHRSAKLQLSLLFYFAMAPLNVLWMSLLCTVSLVKVATGTTGEWVVTSRSTKTKASSKEALQSSMQPLLRQVSPRIKSIDGKLPCIDSTWCILTFAFLSMGALFGIVGGQVGYYLGLHKRVFHHYCLFGHCWGRDTYKYEEDTRMIALGQLAGVAFAGLIVIVLRLWVRFCGSKGFSRSPFVSPNSSVSSDRPKALPSPNSSVSSDRPKVQEEEGGREDGVPSGSSSARSFASCPSTPRRSLTPSPDPV